MLKSKRRQDKEHAIRALIADAVAAVMLREGPMHVSVDMIAKEAGLSKGGVFYYYPNKSELMLSLFERYLQRFYTRRREVMQSLPETRDKIVKATFAVLFENIDLEKGDQVYLSKLFEVPGFCETMAAAKADLLAGLREGVENPENITLAFLLFDGLWVDMLMKPRPLFERDFDIVKQRAWELLDDLVYTDAG